MEEKQQTELSRAISFLEDRLKRTEELIQETAASDNEPFLNGEWFGIFCALEYLRDRLDYLNKINKV